MSPLTESLQQHISGEVPPTPDNLQAILDEVIELEDLLDSKDLQIDELERLIMELEGRIMENDAETADYICPAELAELISPLLTAIEAIYDPRGWLDIPGYRTAARKIGRDI